MIPVTRPVVALHLAFSSKRSGSFLSWLRAQEEKIMAKIPKTKPKKKRETIPQIIPAVAMQFPSFRESGLVEPEGALVVALGAETTIGVATVLIVVSSLPIVLATRVDSVGAAVETFSTSLVPSLKNLVVVVMEVPSAAMVVSFSVDWRTRGASISVVMMY